MVQEKSNTNSKGTSKERFQRVGFICPLNETTCRYARRQIPRKHQWWRKGQIYNVFILSCVWFLELGLTCILYGDAFSQKIDGMLIRFQCLMPFSCVPGETYEDKKHFEYSICCLCSLVGTLSVASVGTTNSRKKQFF